MATNGKSRSRVTWNAFRRKYSKFQVSTFRRKDEAESNLNIVARIMRPRYLEEINSAAVLDDLQARLLEGEGLSRQRSPHTVKKIMGRIVAALRWAEYMGLIGEVSKFRKLRTSKLRQMKGRPLTDAEFKAMLAATPEVVGPHVAAAWQSILRGLLTSGLRVGELMRLHWSDDSYIVPVWQPSKHAVLKIPSAMQKNNTDEAIPILPAFEQLLNETPVERREGWVFESVGVNRFGRAPRKDRRLSLHRIIKVISAIGRESGVVVIPGRDGQPAKFASSHDLRRTCAENLISTGVSEREVACVLRHASASTTRRYYAPGSVQRAAEIVRQCGDLDATPSNPAMNPVSTAHTCWIPEENYRDRRWLERAICDVEHLEGWPRAWSVRIEAVQRRYSEITGADSPFPWSDLAVIELWEALPG